MKAPVAAVSSLTEVKVPQRMVWRAMTGKKRSRRLRQEQLVGTKCRVMRWRGEQALVTGPVAISTANAANKVVTR
jgi:hypothetical protein